jgi:hypothetical protein
LQGVTDECVGRGRYIESSIAKMMTVEGGLGDKGICYMFLQSVLAYCVRRRSISRG